MKRMILFGRGLLLQPAIIKQSKQVTINPGTRLTAFCNWDFIRSQGLDIVYSKITNISGENAPRIAGGEEG